MCCSSTYSLQWLHYIILKLLSAKRLRPPAISRSKGRTSNSPKSLSERESYELLLDVEELLEKTLKTRTCRTEDPVRSAGDVWKYALKKGWVKSNL